jgi:hypothetical protein
MKNIIFIFSMPRSGSTLLQRILAVHPAIATVSEPWVLLPFMYALKPQGLFSEYDHSLCHTAVRDFIEHLPHGHDDYYAALRYFAESLYQKCCRNNEIYFLDKTPRYYLILSQIARTFPDAKFIFLFRNPLQVMSSIVTSRTNNRLLLHLFHVDLYQAPYLLARSYHQMKHKSTAVFYDNLVANPSDTIENLCDYLELRYDDSLIESFHHVTLDGRMGDKTGYHNYSRIEYATVEKWKQTFNTAYRKRFAKNYAKRLGPDVFETFGCNLDATLHELDMIKTVKSGFLLDSVDRMIGAMIRFFEILLIWKKIKRHLGGNEPYLMHR